MSPLEKRPIQKDPQHGDHFFLFTCLSISSELYDQLPIQLSPGIGLAPTPYHAIERGAPAGSSIEHHVGLGAWVYLGHGLGMGHCHSCLKIDSSFPMELARRYGWMMAGALYLAKPIYMAIGGAFRYGTLNDGLLGREASHIYHRSNVSLDSFFSHKANGKPLLQYEKADFVLASKLFPLILNCFENRKCMPRSYSILQLFFEAVLWERLYYASSSFSKLFPALDAFAGNPPRHHANRVASRLSKFLENTPSAITGNLFSAQEIEIRLKAIWNDHRPPGLHGYVKDPSFPESTSQQEITPEIKDLFDLVEITRVAIIKMLLLEPSVFQAYNQIPIPQKRDTDADIRTALSTAFFDQSYSSPKEAVVYSDLSPLLSKMNSMTAKDSS